MLKVNLLSHTPNPEEVIASAAKLCYSPVGIDEIMEKQSEESIEKFIKRLSSIKHLSPFEHASFTFAVEGVSRTLTHQLVRHRLASYSQQSQRYVKESLFEYIVPPAIENNKRAKKVFIEQMESSQRAYDDIVIELMYHKLINHKNYSEWGKKVAEYTEIEDGDGCWCIKTAYEDMIKGEDYSVLLGYLDIFKDNFAKEYSALEKEVIEDSRYVFPNATETKIVITMNARSLMHFLELRCCNRAQWEIRRLADKMLFEAVKIAPAIFMSSGAKCTFGKCPEGSMSCGKPRSIEDIIGK